MGDSNEEHVEEEVAYYEELEVEDNPFLLTAKEDIKWRHHLQIMPAECNWQEPDNSHLTKPEDPVVYFKRYITDSLINTMVEMSNTYAIQKGTVNFKNTNKKEIEVLIGLHLAIGSLKFPRIRLYWENMLGIGLFKNSMTRNRFFKLRNNLHVINNLEIDVNNTDKFKKVRPVINAVVKRCQEISHEKNVCVDEQIIPFKGKHSAKQYTKGKPNPWGIKVFLLCGKSGLAYNFILYQGKSTEIDRNIMSRYGLGASIVLHLSQNTVSPGTRMYIDNFFTTYHLLQTLKRMSINTAGTARVNRFAKPPFMSEKDLMRRGRGAMQELTSSDNDIVLVRWFDNRPVTMASNFIGIGTTNVTKRWDKNKKVYVDVVQPEVIQLYNHSKGGVDKLDFLLELYRTFIRSRKWTLRVIFHFIDLAVCNGWLEYKRDCSICKIDKKSQMDLLEFRMSIAYALVQSGTTVKERKRGRPSLEDNEVELHTLAAHHEKRPPASVRLDTIDHLPVHCGKKEAGRCKTIGCKGRSHYRCEKCNVYLCLSKDRNCFRTFHIN